MENNFISVKEQSSSDSRGSDLSWWFCLFVFLQKLVDVWKNDPDTFSIQSHFIKKPLWRVEAGLFPV